ncbi:MAG: T9SS type A sorting domain-containing protein [Maribacter sp.]|uniref:T9SS type A sorting domain-containing protein n=1 Tax=Maribacter sp. TaxID=1897614 RepID=UPI003298AF7F
MKSIGTYVLILTTATLSAQSIDKTVVASAGSTMSVSELTIGYTIGESIVGFTTNENTIDQGFWAGSLQVENITEQKDLDGIVVYPNPVVNELSIFTDKNEVYGITLFAVDGSGVLKQTVEPTRLEHKIDLSYLSRGVYILRLFIKGDTEEKLFKIIKK